MTLADLLATLRHRLDDRVLPYQWEDQELIEAINRAEQEACFRADLLLDADTMSVCRVAVLAGIGRYNLSPLILDLRRVAFGETDQTLERTSQARLDRDGRSWETRTGTPRRYVMDVNGRTLRLDALPEANATLYLSVARLPLEVMEDESDEPEIPERYHLDLLHWAMHLAYEKRDSLSQETYDPTLGAGEALAFERIFGPRRDAGAQERRLREPVRRATAQYF